jgi:hypothetical protein
MTTVGGDVGTGLRVGSRPYSRRRDRRNGIHGILATLAQGLRDEHAALALRARFEDALRQVMPLRAVRLREVPPEFGLPPTQSSKSLQSLRLEIPMSGQDRRALLEATVDHLPGLDDWDSQTLGAAAHLASLVLEIEKGAGVLGDHKAPRRRHEDGA